VDLKDVMWYAIIAKSPNVILLKEDIKEFLGNVLIAKNLLIL
jgi:hypothetical protein